GKGLQRDGRGTSPEALARPHPPIMIGGGGERKTLRLVARYAQACNLFPGPELARKLDVLRAHCDAEGRDYDEITKTVYFIFDPGRRARRPPRWWTSSAGSPRWASRWPSAPWRTYGTCGPWRSSAARASPRSPACSGAPARPNPQRRMGAGGFGVCQRVLRAYRCTASGAKTARNTADQPSTASSGCCIGQASTRADGFGFPNSWRHAAATAL